MEHTAAMWSAASTLTRARIIVFAVVATTATATAGYLLFQQLLPPPFSHPASSSAPNGSGDGGGRIRRMNAVRHRRRSRPSVLPRHPDDDDYDDEGEEELPGGHTHDGTANDENAREWEYLGELVDHDGAPGPPGPPPGHEEGEPNGVVDYAAAEFAAAAERDENWYDNDGHAEPQRAGQNIVNLLFRVSEDNARRTAYVHRGCQCDWCGIVPIRGVRYRCANCSNFDLCEICESQDVHTKAHIFYKIKVPTPKTQWGQRQGVCYLGDADHARLLPRALMARLARETGFERPELESCWEQWTYMACTEWRDDPDELYLATDRRTFQRCMVPLAGGRHSPPNLLYDRMFAFYDTNGDDLISFPEWVHGLSYRKRRDRLRKLFSGYDLDGDGYISRRDCLRLFRAYFVMFQQLTRNMLEGLNEQFMNSVEARNVLSGRAPLSSAFGRDSAVPAGEADRFLAGKASHSDGTEINTLGDRAGVVHEDMPDTMDRDDILRRLFTTSHSSRWSALANGARGGGIGGIGGGDGEATETEELASQYAGAMLDPPQRVEELPALLSGLERTRPAPNMTLASVWDTAAAAAAGLSDQGAEAEAEAEADDQADEGSNGSRDATAAEENVAPEQQQEDMIQVVINDASGLPVRTFVDGLGRIESFRDAERERENRERAERRRAERRARKAVLDRWRRRMFYLDEEEGQLAPPDGWDSDDDVLVQSSLAFGSSSNNNASNGAGKSGEGSSSGAGNGITANANANGNASASGAGKPQRPHPLSPRSRSSSKVRFAEDTPANGGESEWEERSNVSTSSRRSVPERWGGMDISDAERDAGKEVLYQVMQQAFNEVLDLLFKAKEDEAVRNAETKAKREQHRAQWEAIDLPAEQWLDKILDMLGWDQIANLSGNDMMEPRLAPYYRDMYLNGPMSFCKMMGSAKHDTPDTVAESQEVGEDELLEEPYLQTMKAMADGDDDYDVEILEEEEEEGEGEHEEEEEEEREDASPGSAEYRDPTMPQFRPDSATTTQSSITVAAASASNPARRKKSTIFTTASASASTAAPTTTTAPNHNTNNNNNSSSSSSTKNSTTMTIEEIKLRRQTLIGWKQDDVREQEEARRGGWGRLAYDEFEQLYRGEERGDNRLDYLSTWIDFCIS